MFSALDDGEMQIVIDAIEEAKFGPGEKIITEGD